jgi:hypothetical protein
VFHVERDNRPSKAPSFLTGYRGHKPCENASVGSWPGRGRSGTALPIAGRSAVERGDAPCGAHP